MGITKKKRFIVDFEKVFYHLHRTIGELMDLYEEKDEDDEDRNVIMHWVYLLTRLQNWVGNLWAYDKGLDELFDYNYIVEEINAVLSECGIRELDDDFERVLLNSYSACTKATNYLICYGIM